MADANLALLVNLYVILLHANCNGLTSYILEDDVVMESIVRSATNLDSQHCRIAMSTATLHDYQIAIGLLCFDNKLRYWVKPRCTLWFS